MKLRRVISLLTLVSFSMRSLTALAGEPQMGSDQHISLKGKVIRKGGGAVEGADVRCVGEGQAKCDPEVSHTDKEGNFSFGKIEPSKAYVLAVRHPLFLAPADYAVQTSEPLASVTIVLEPYIIKGFAVEAGTNTRVAEATVQYIKGAGQPEQVGQSSTGSNGEFEYQPLDKLLDPQQSYTLIVTHGRYASTRVPNVRLQDPPKEISVELLPIVAGNRYDLKTVWGTELSARVLEAGTKSLYVTDIKTSDALFTPGQVRQTIPVSSIAAVFKHKVPRKLVILGVVAGAAATAALVLGSR